MKVGILGAGAFALALADVINNNNHEVVLWSKLKEEIESINETHISDKLPNYKIPKNFIFTNDLKEATNNIDLLVIALPIAFIDSTCYELSKLDINVPICIASKGIEQEHFLFASDIVEKYFDKAKISVISGPSFANDIIKKTPTGVTLAATNKEVINIIKNTFENDYFKIRKSNDIIGVEVCGSIKNILAITAGILFGMDMPSSTIAMFLTESIHDIENLLTALNCNLKTSLSYAGIGDLILTCTSVESRNFTLGTMIGSKKSKLKINNYINNTTIEGLYSLKSLKKLLDNKKINMPIINITYEIIYKNKDLNSLITFLIDKM